MSAPQPTRQVLFHHTVLAGSPYEVGRLQGDSIKDIPGWADFFRSGRGSWTAQDFQPIFSLFDRYCPGLNEEIAGLADSLASPVEEVIYYANTYLRPGHCSHVAVLPAASAGGHVLVGRSYEFGDSTDDKRLCTTRMTGRYAHLGFSTMFFGRSEGLNEHGLAVTTSSAGIPVGREPGLRPPIQAGFQFWALVRAILEGCRTVAEALALIEAMPLCGKANLIIADRAGGAALIETYGPHHAVKSLAGAGPEAFLYSTNHFTQPAMIAHEAPWMRNSLVRAETIRAVLDRAAPAISRETLKELLSARYPAGLCCHYYDEFFGTLHSIVFDLTAGEAEICFGSPQANDWHRFTLTAEPEQGQYPVHLPLEQAGPEFWQ